MNIEKYIIQYQGETFSNSEQALDFWRKALKENTETTCKAMLVEKRKYVTQPAEYKGSNANVWREGFNQCCALQKEKAKNLTNK